MTTTSSVKIEGRYDLLALHRGLMEARYCDVANDFDVSASPILARIHREVVDAIIQVEQHEGKDPSAWQKWLQIDPARREWRIAVGRARSSSLWMGLPVEQRREFARDVLSPFLLTGELVDRFIEEVGEPAAE